MNGPQEVKDHPFFKGRNICNVFKLFKGLNWENFRKKGGLIIPSLKEVNENQKDIDEIEKIFFNSSELNSKKRTHRIIDIDEFKLRRVDLLDQLNQETYNELIR